MLGSFWVNWLPFGQLEDWAHGLQCCGCVQSTDESGPACRLVAKVHDWDLEGRWLKPWCSHDKICPALRPLSKALNPTLLQGVSPPA